MRFIFSTLTVMFVGLGAAGAAQAEQWQHSLTPYLWASGIDGTTTVGTALGPVESDVDVPFSDIWDNLDIGGMLSYRGENGPVAIMADAVYADIEADKSATGGPIRVDASVGVKTTILEADVGYRFARNFVAFGGLRYNDLETDLTVVRTGPGPGVTRSAAGSESWVDPVIGMLAELPLGESWTVSLRGDIGGFGVGSDFAWQAAGTVRWQATDLIHVVVGYRYYDVDYQDGSGTSELEYDMAMSGPALGVGFTF